MDLRMTFDEPDLFSAEFSAQTEQSEFDAEFNENDEEFDPELFERGSDGIGIAKIEQSVVSKDDGGENIISITLTNGDVHSFKIYNGSQAEYFRKLISEHNVNRTSHEDFREEVQQKMTGLANIEIEALLK